MIGSILKADDDYRPTSGLAKHRGTGLRINMDFSQRVVIDTEALDWVDSPAKGVRRRMLDREAAESGRATSLVSYEPESYFPAHTHTGGEEFLILEGTFSDQHGDYGPGMYVRNPVGSSHKPFTKGGCIILVKLWQMDAEDQDFLRIDTREPPALRPGAAAGDTPRSAMRAVRFTSRPGTWIRCENSYLEPVTASRRVLQPSCTTNASAHRLCPNRRGA
jgi:hypothetical protein